jgi:hypothetical protein
MNIYFGAIAEKTRAPVAWLKTCAPKKSPIHSTRARACFHLHPRSPPALSTASQSSHPLCACFRLHPRPPLGASGMRLQPWMHDPAWPSTGCVSRAAAYKFFHPPAPSTTFPTSIHTSSVQSPEAPSGVHQLPSDRKSVKTPSGCQIRGAQVCKST